jgi:hypothetical protein
MRGRGKKEWGTNKMGEREERRKRWERQRQNKKGKRD